MKSRGSTRYGCRRAVNGAQWLTEIVGNANIGPTCIKQDWPERRASACSSSDEGFMADVNLFAAAAFRDSVNGGDMQQAK